MANLSHNEIELLKASIQGNTVAFESIVKKYQSYVCAITYSAIPDVEKSEDMAQETFLHVWNNLSTLKDLTKFKSWLISITRNIISDFIKKQKHDLINKAASIEQVDNAQTKQIEPAHQAMTQEQQAVVQNALMQIPEKYREPLVLFYRHEQSVKIIAEQLDLSEELVKQHLSRGRKLLREQVASMVEGSIGKSGPTKAFTSIVMASIAGLAVKGTVATAAVAGTSAIMSSISAKFIAAAAVIAIGIGTVVTYNHFTKPEQDNQNMPPISLANDIETVIASNDNLSGSSMNIETAAIQESVQSENISVANAEENSFENNESVSKTPAITLKNKPIDSPYEYFLFTRFNRESSTNTLVLVHITDNGIELQEIITESESSYHWREPICITGGKLYGTSYFTLYSIDLLTKETEKLSIRSTGSADYYNFNFSAAVSFADNCLYGLSQKGNTATLRQLDFERRVFRDIANVSNSPPDKIMAISPDKKYLAYFTSGNNQSRGKEGYLLTIVEVESGKITQPAKPINFIIPMIASSFPSIPVIWLDVETVAFVRSEAPEGENEFSTTRGGVNMLSMVNINTGKMEDITPLPGNPYMQFAPNLVQDNIGIGPLIQPRPDHKDNYRLDLNNRKLVENDSIAGDYRYAFEHLYYKEQDLGSAKSRYYKVSPDGKRIIWMSNETTNMDFADLYYYDPEQEKPVAIAIVYNSTGLWLKAEDLKERLPKTISGTKWTPLKDLSKNLPVQTYTDTRKNVRDYLSCTIKTDKNTYLLHEPIMVTLTLTNKSDSDVTVRKPYVFESVMRPLSGLTLNYPGGQKTSIDCGAQPYSSPDEDVLIKAGESFVTTDTVEVNSPGNYSLEYKYEMSNVHQEYKGTIITEPSTFNVLSIDDSEKEKQLFDAKFARIMKRFYKETAKDPNWNGNNNISDEVIGLPGMGPKAAPYIIKAIDGETKKYSRQMLLTALSRIADSQYIPYFKERLINGETDNVCNWLIKTYSRSGTNDDIRQQVIEALITGMSNTEVEARRRVCSYLTKIYDKNIEKCFTKAVEDEDVEIKLDAGFYLAAAKWLELTDWLKLAESKFDYVNYISACAVVKKLEQQYNISKGELPVLSKEDFASAEKFQEAEQDYMKVLGDWLAWSQQNPRASFLFFEDYRNTWWENDPLRQE